MFADDKPKKAKGSGYLPIQPGCTYAYLYKLDEKTACVSKMMPAVEWLSSRCKSCLDKDENFLNSLREVELYLQVFKGNESLEKIEEKNKWDNAKLPLLIKLGDKIYIRGITEKMERTPLIPLDSKEWENIKFPQTDKNPSKLEKKLSEKEWEAIRKVHSLRGESKLVQDVAKYLYKIFQCASNSADKTLVDNISHFIGHRRFFGISPEWEEEDFKKYEQKKGDPQLSDGTVYTLTGDHTWEFNRSWMNTLITGGLPFYIISSISEDHLHRGHSCPPPKDKGPYLMSLDNEVKWPHDMSYSHLYLPLLVKKGNEIRLIAVNRSLERYSITKAIFINEQKEIEIVPDTTDKRSKQTNSKKDPKFSATLFPSSGSLPKSLNCQSGNKAVKGFMKCLVQDQGDFCRQDGPENCSAFSREVMLAALSYNYNLMANAKIEPNPETKQETKQEAKQEAKQEKQKKRIIWNRKLDELCPIGVSKPPTTNSASPPIDTLESEYHCVKKIKDVYMEVRRKLQEQQIKTEGNVPRLEAASTSGTFSISSSNSYSTSTSFGNCNSTPSSSCGVFSTSSSVFSSSQGTSPGSSGILTNNALSSTSSATKEEKKISKEEAKMSVLSPS